MNIQQLIERGEKTDTENESEFSVWQDFAQQFIKENYGNKQAMNFAAATSVMSVYITVLDGQVNRPDRKSGIENGLKLLRVLAEYPQNPNTQEKNRLRSKQDLPTNNNQNTLTNENNIFISLSVGQALAALSDFSEKLEEPKKSKVKDLIEELRTFASETIGTAIGTAGAMILKDRLG